VVDTESNLGIVGQPCKRPLPFYLGIIRRPIEFGG
jgi:hypothetical protein